MKKKFLLASMIVVLMMLFAMPFSVMAATENYCTEIDDCSSELLSITPTDVTPSFAPLSIEQLRVKFPHGKHWNHKVTANSNNGDNLAINDDESYANSVTNYPCANHSGPGAIGQYDCNYFDGGLQCYGFAHKLGYDFTGGIYPSTWAKVYTLDGLKVGDIIRFGGHSAFVIAVNSSGGVSLAEGNYGYDCSIHWDRYITKTQIYNKGLEWVRKCPTVSHSHSYTLKNYEAAHPHKEYTYCSCGKINPSPYTGNVYFNANCSSCKAIGAPKGVSVSVTGNSVTVKWNKTSYTHHYDVYLVQSPYRWEDIKYKGKSTGNSYTFSNVKNGDYRAFVIARPNKDQTQSSWVNVKVPNNPVSIKIYFENNDKKQSIGTTNAVLSKIIKLDGADISKVTKVGISLYDAHGNLLKTKSETPIASGSYIEAWYNINEELGYILTPGTTYQYQFSATVNGVSFSSNREFFTTLSPTPTPTPTPTPVPSVKFTDVKSDAYYATPVAWAVAMEVTSGTSATTFSPDNACTRGQAVTFLWRAAGKPAPKSSYNPFTDVKAGQYYYDAVLWAVENGITMGTSATTFSPDATCNRGQIVTFLYRAEGEPDVAVRSTFGDVKTDAYYAKAVTWAVDNGVTSGTSSTTFSPDNDCTRGQIVTFLYRAEN